MPAADLFEVFTSIQGEGLYVGKRQIFIRFAGCNLNCRYCDTKYSFTKPYSAKFENTPLSQNFYEERNPIPAFKLNEYIDLCYTLDSTIHSISLTGGEPLLQVEFLEFFLRMYKKDRIFHLETNGTLPENLKQLIDLIDFISMDIKLNYLSDAAFLAKQAEFLRLANAKPLQVKTVITRQDNVAYFQKAVSIINDVSADIPLIIQPDSNEMPEISLLISLQKEAANKLKDVRILPQIHPFLSIK